MRSIPALLVLAAVAFALIACGGDNVSTPEIVSPTTDHARPTTAQNPTSKPAANTPTTGRSETTSQTEPPPNIVAEVNGTPISMAEFQRQLTDERTYLLNEGMIDPDTAEGQAALSNLRNQVLNQLIDQVLIVQAAEQMGITVTEEELEASIAQIKEDLGSEEAFAESLAANNLAEEQFRKLQRRQLLSRKVMDQVTSGIPDEAEQVHARHILVETREEAESILAQLENGADFAELAKKHSIDETTKESGGDLGFFPRGVVLPEFEEVAFSLNVGERSGAVQTAFGYHIIEVLERETRPIPDEIKEGLRQQMITTWLQTQRAQVDIKRYLER